ncbi:hypothetical protein QYM36_004867 [Artemia franciscana]|uniref:Oxidative stress-responsive serine-rich protein 1 n=1 Tax=Artemia franciscana TaxID=6661 RepID=A0AA88LAM4_ARTSF|nr:hypothetical protein QYM36_004867 [Artemia franciscana]
MSTRKMKNVDIDEELSKRLDEALVTGLTKKLLKLHSLSCPSSFKNTKTLIRKSRLNYFQSPIIRSSKLDFNSGKEYNQVTRLDALKFSCIDRVKKSKRKKDLNGQKFGSESEFVNFSDLKPTLLEVEGSIELHSNLRSSKENIDEELEEISGNLKATKPFKKRKRTSSTQISKNDIKMLTGRECSPTIFAQQARQCVTEDISIDELAGYFDACVHIPKKMSYMAEMMYT